LVREGDAYQLSANTCFPIGECLKKYKARFRGGIKGMSKAGKKAICILKPYGGGDDRLWGLHHLDIMDKHRLLVASVIVPARLRLPD
jgi:hypothetical protein